MGGCSRWVSYLYTRSAKRERFPRRILTHSIGTGCFAIFIRITILAIGHKPTSGKVSDHMLFLAVSRLVMRCFARMDADCFRSLPLLCHHFTLRAYPRVCVVLRMDDWFWQWGVFLVASRFQYAAVLADVLENEFFGGSYIDGDRWVSSLYYSNYTYSQY